MKTLSFLAIVALISHASASPGAHGWAQYQHDASHTSRTADALQAKALALAWSAGGFTVPLISGESVYAKMSSGTSTTVNSFGIEDGHVQWSYNGSSLYNANLSVGPGFVAVFGFDSILIIIG